MRLLSLKLFLFFIYLLFTSNTSADQKPDIKNLKIHKDPKQISNIVFKDYKDLAVSLEDFKDSLVLINFWATWCAPCKEEMPSLDLLQINENLNNLKIIPINIGKEDTKKIQQFFTELKVKNLEIYFDTPVTLAKKLSLRGVPTTILFNKKGEEFARIVGSIDFTDKKFIKWLETYN